MEQGQSFPFPPTTPRKREREVEKDTLDPGDNEIVNRQVDGMTKATHYPIHLPSHHPFGEALGEKFIFEGKSVTPGCCGAIYSPSKPKTPTPIYQTLSVIRIK